MSLRLKNSDQAWQFIAIAADLSGGNANSGVSLHNLRLGSIEKDDNEGNSSFIFQALIRYHR